MKSVLQSVLLAVLFLVRPLTGIAGDYEKAWEALLRNDKTKARELFQKAIRNNDNKNSALATLILFESNEGFHEQLISKYNNPARQFSPQEAYWYALWFNEGVLSEYGKKKADNLSNLDHMLTAPGFNGSMKAAGAYTKGNHYYSSMELEKSKEMFASLQALEDWQFAGPFDNINGSGFNKNYGPLTQLEPGKGFISYNNTAIDWFTPSLTNRQGWLFVGTVFPTTAAIGYTQTFVHADAEKDALLCLGGGGAFRVWLNDKELISEPDEKTTELDFYKVKCHLNKGYNRVLVQIGYTTETSNPNFIVRLTNERYEPLKGITSTSKLQPYTRDLSASRPVPVTHFAEEYFRRQIEKNPKDLANYVMLSYVYVRNEENDKAKAILAPLVEKYPQSSFIQLQYYRTLSSKRHHTEMTEKLETVKTMDPDNYWMMNLEVTRLEEEKKYQEALDVVYKMIAKAGPAEATTLQRINNIGRLEKLDSMVLLLKEAYAAYPENVSLVAMMHYLETNLNRNPSAGLAVLEKYCARAFNYEMLKKLASEYFKQNMPEKGEKVLRKILEYVPYDSNPYEELAAYFFGRQQYDSAIVYQNKLHSFTPYYHKALGDIGYSYLQQNNKDKALEYFKKALALHGGMYAYRKQIRSLEGKKDIFSYFPEADVYNRIQAAFKKPEDTTHSHYYIFDEKNVVLYPDGASEKEVLTAVHLRNNSGIESWKELTLPYNSVYETITIVKAEVIKANGNKVPGEIYDNQVVFTKLEPGDAIFYHYRMSSYGIGRLGREFWDKFYFSASVPTKSARYSILAAEQVPLRYDFSNKKDIRPAISKQEDFKLYTWEMKNVPAFKHESFMPSVDDFGDVLHLSTVKSWDMIAEWYSDITRMQSREEYDVNVAFAKIFPGGTSGLSDMEKAKKIYEFIEENIGYSSVPFRQGAYVPQRAAKTLATRLGDCKDMSALFLAFAHKAGLEANMVLVSTRNNGVKGITLPSMEFNHCIVQYKAGNQHRYLELTDRYLPFGALPQSVQLAQMLPIPYQYKGTAEKLTSVDATAGGNGSTIIRKVHVKVNKADVEVKTRSAVTGNLASLQRGRFRNGTPDENKEGIRSDIASFYKNHVELKDFSFRNLDNLTDTVAQEVNYVVKNEIVNVGDFSMLRPSFHEAVATQGIFTDEERKYPFVYWSYENTEKYVTEVEIELPEGKVFNQVPSGFKGKYDWMDYTLSYEQVAGNKLKIRREFVTDPNKDVTPEVFAGMKDFFNKIIENEQKYISFK